MAIFDLWEGCPEKIVDLEEVNTAYCMMYIKEEDKIFAGHKKIITIW